MLATRGRNNTGSVLNHLGMFEEAQAMLERALHDARARRMRILEAFALHNVGMSYARLGNLDEGISCQRHAARIADETGAARLRIHTRCYEAIFLVWRGAPGDLGAAHNLARYVCDETRSNPQPLLGRALRDGQGAARPPLPRERARDRPRGRTSASPPAPSRSGTSTCA